VQLDAQASTASRAGIARKALRPSVCGLQVDRAMRLLIVTSSAVVAALFACGGSSSDSFVDPGTSPDAAPSTPDGGPADDASTLDSGSTSDAGSALVTAKDLKIAGHSQPFDVYFPTNAKRVVVFLHGGLGKKEISPNQIGVTIDGAPDAVWLASKETAFVFPQGSAIAAAPAATTWSNYVMTSGEDDVAFLSALADTVRAGTIAPTIPAVARVYVAGHSNGGMMANRLWCEASTRFDGFAAFAGPASESLRAGGSAPCAPSAPKPYLGVIGSADDTIQTTGNWANPIWTVDPKLTSGPSFVDPDVVNEETFHREVRVPKVCAAAATAPVDAGTTTTWSDCADKVRLVRVNGADHCLKSTAACASSLEGTLGQPLRDLLVGFFVSNE